MQKLFIVLALGTLSSVAVNAGTIGPSCGSCFGGIYTLDAVLFAPNVGSGTETWQVTYTLDVEGVTDSTITSISSIAAKVTSNVIKASTTFTPTGTNTGWTTTSGVLANNGCKISDKDKSGWICLQLGNAPKLLTGTNTPIYSWVFNVETAAGSLLSDASIKANFADANGKLLSESITTTSVPEGSSPELPIVLSGLGLLMFGRNRWKRRMAA